MSDRYFVESPIQGTKAVLVGPEAHHLIHVMRAEPGVEVVLFDGSGMEYTGRVEKVGRSEVRIEIVSHEEVDRELPLDLTLGVSLPKGDRQKWLVEKAVELGVRRIVPLRTVRSVAQPIEQALSRLRRTVVEASKQCGRTRLLAVEEPRAWADFVTAPGETACCWIAHPGGIPVAQLGEAVRGTASVMAAIGPEGGFSAEEVAMAVAAGWQPVDLGPRILRVETAAIWLSALAVHAFGGEPRSAGGGTDAGS